MIQEEKWILGRSQLVPYAKRTSYSTPSLSLSFFDPLLLSLCAFVAGRGGPGGPGGGPPPYGGPPGGGACHEILDPEP